MDEVPSGHAYSRFVSLMGMVSTTRKSMVLVLGSKILQLGRDVNPIGIVKSSEVQINNSTLYQLKDELVGASEGSTDVTVSNNWFKNQDKVMLLGHDDSYVEDTGG